MSQNGKRRSPSEEVQEHSSKRQRLGESRDATTATNTALQANVTGHPTNANQTTTAITGGQPNKLPAYRGPTLGHAAGVGGAVENNGGRVVQPTNSTAAKGKRRASSPAPEEPSPKQSARGQRRAGLQDAGLNDKERGTLQERNGQLHCMHPADKKWVPAVFHSAIRADLIAAASAQGSYSVDRVRSGLENDETSYLESQKDWSGERQEWHKIRHDVLNKHERDGWRDDYHGQKAEVWIHTDGRMVIDHDRNPMYRHPDLPDTLSSAVEGWYLEAVMRLDSRIQRETIRGRLPDARKPPKSRKVETESMFALSAISNKRMRFRRHEGLVAWDSRKGSTELNDYFRSFIPQTSLDRNSNEGGRALTKAERDHAEKLSKGKEGLTKKRKTSSSTTTPIQRTAAAPLLGFQGPASYQGRQPADRGSMLPRAGNLTSPSPSAREHGQRLNRGHQAGPAFNSSAYPSLSDELFNPYHGQRLEPYQSAFAQEKGGPLTPAMGLQPPPQFNGTTLPGTSSLTHYHNVEDQLASQPQRLSGPEPPEQPRNRVSTTTINSTPGQTSHKTARSVRRGRARWRNNNPPFYSGAGTTPTGGPSAGDGSNNREHSSVSNGALDHTQSTRPLADRLNNGERHRPSGELADNHGTGSRGGRTFYADVVPQSNDSNGNRRERDSVQRPRNSAREAPAPDVNQPRIQDGQGLQLGDNPFAHHDGWPTTLDLELLGWLERGNLNADPSGSGIHLDNTPQGTDGGGSTTQLHYDNSAPLQDGQQNSVWQLDDNGIWVLDDAPAGTVRDQPVDASDNVANRQPPADTIGKPLASTRNSPLLYQTGETGISMGDTLVPTTSTVPQPIQPTTSPVAVSQHTSPDIDTTQQTAPFNNASFPSPDMSSTTRSRQNQPAGEIDPRHAIPANHFQYATIQTLLEPTRRAFQSAFRDDSWRDYIPRDYVPPTDRSLSYQGVFEQLSMDFWEIWTSRYGYDAVVPPLAQPSDIDEFSAVVLRGLPG